MQGLSDPHGNSSTQTNLVVSNCINPKISHYIRFGRSISPKRIEIEQKMRCKKIAGVWIFVQIILLAQLMSLIVRLCPKKLLLRNSFEVGTKEWISRMWNIFAGNSSTLQKKKAEKKANNSEVKLKWIGCGFNHVKQVTIAMTLKSPGNAGPTMAT